MTWMFLSLAHAAVVTLEDAAGNALVGEVDLLPVHAIEDQDAFGIGDIKVAFIILGKSPVFIPGVVVRPAKGGDGGNFLAISRLHAKYQYSTE